MNNKWNAYGNNIEIKPVNKDKVIGDTSKYYLYGEVIAKGDEVSSEIEIGDTIGYTQWGTNKIVMADGSEHFFVQDNPDFVLAIIKKNDDNKAQFFPG